MHNGVSVVCERVLGQRVWISIKTFIGLRLYTASRYPTALSISRRDTTALRIRLAILHQPKTKNMFFFNNKKREHYRRFFDRIFKNNKVRMQWPLVAPLHSYFVIVKNTIKKSTVVTSTYNNLFEKASLKKIICTKFVHITFCKQLFQHYVTYCVFCLLVT